MYSAEISRKNPGCFIFLLDQSGSMDDAFGGSGERRKADELTTIINKLIHNLSIRCAKGDSIYDYFHVAVIGYGEDTAVKSAFNGPLSGDRPFAGTSQAMPASTTSARPTWNNSRAPVSSLPPHAGHVPAGSPLGVHFRRHERH